MDIYQHPKQPLEQAISSGFADGIATDEVNTVTYYALRQEVPKSGPKSRDLRASPSTANNCSATSGDFSNCRLHREIQWGAHVKKGEMVTPKMTAFIFYQLIISPLVSIKILLILNKLSAL